MEGSNDLSGRATRRVCLAAVASLTVLASIISFAPGAGAAVPRSVTGHRATGTLSHLMATSPLSESVLVARALRAGTLQLPRTAGGVPSSTAQPNVRVSEGGMPVNSPVLAVNPADPSQLLSGANDYNCASHLGFYASGDSGATWNHTCMPVVGLGGCGDATVAYGMSGTEYAAGIGNCDGLTGSVAMQTSNDNGGSWSPARVVIKPLFRKGITDRPYIDTDRSPSSPFANSLYVAAAQFDQNSDSEITVSSSQDSGATFKTVKVDRKEPWPTVDQFSTLTVGADGAVVVAWVRCTANGPAGDCGGTTARVLSAASTDGGTTWSAPVTVSQGTMAPDSCSCAFDGNIPTTDEPLTWTPSLAAGPSNQAAGASSAACPPVWAYYMTVSWYSGFFNLQHHYALYGSCDHQHWSFLYGHRTSFAGSAGSHLAFHTEAATRPPNSVAVSWQETSHEPSGFPRIDTWVTLSDDGGNTFGSPIEVSAKSSDPRYDGFGGSFYGDQTGLVWAGGNAKVVFGDTRSGVNTQVFEGGVVP